MASEAPRATVSGTASLTVGRGPVPRHATIAGETRSEARMASEGPRPTGPKTIAGDRPPPYGIRNSLAYRRARACPSPCCVNRKIAGDRPPRYGIQNALAYRRARACPSPCNDRGGNPLACTMASEGHRPTGTSRPGGLSYREDINL